MPSAPWRAGAERPSGHPGIGGGRGSWSGRRPRGEIRVRGWSGGIASAGLPRPPPGGPRGGSLSWAYGRRSPDHCPVAFSFATAWLRLTPILRTSSAARSRAWKASAQRRVRCRDLAPRDREGGFGGVRAACQPGLAGGGRHLGVLLRRSARTVPCGHAAPDAGCGGAAGHRPAGRRREPRHRAERTPRAFPFSLPSPARMRREFHALTPAWLISVCTLDRARSKRK